VKPSSPNSEATAANEPVAANDFVAATPSSEPEVPFPSKSMDEAAAPTPAAAGETTRAAQTASGEEMTELLEIDAPPAPEEAAVRDPELPPVTEPPTDPNPPAPDPPEPPPLPSPDPLPAPPVTEPPGLEPPRLDPLPAPVPIDAAPTLPFPEKPRRNTAEKVAAALKARGEDADQSPFSVIVNQVYDGPLDLLLDLIRKQDIDIYDIPIAKITAQFLAYVNQLRAGDMDVAGDFIYTAALLIHIKSRMLLPRAPSGPDDTAEDPRRELVDRLLEHERFKNAAQMLHEKQMLEAATWSNPGIREFQDDAGAEPEIAADTTDLVRVFSDILERARSRPVFNVDEDAVTVGQMIQFMARRLTMEDKPVALRRLLSHSKSERALIAMFLALLELVRLQAILLRQDRQFSEIFIKKHTGFDALMNQGLANARDDWR
jgi:segregation and condensation protein A